MKIGVDIDGVLGDQVPHILRRTNRKYRLSMRKRHVTKWNEPIGPSDIEREIEQALFQREYILTMPLVPGSKAALNDLSKKHSIQLVTNRPREMEAATITWARAKGLKFSKLENTRGSSKTDVGVDILVDDNIDNVKGFAESGRVAILFSQPWNQERDCLEPLVRAGRVFYANGWRDVIEVANELDASLACEGREVLP